MVWVQQFKSRPAKRGMQAYEEKIQSQQRDPVGHLRCICGGSRSAGRSHRQQSVLLVDLYDPPVFDFALLL